jgi:hypothetical protein
MSSAEVLFEEPRGSQEGARALFAGDTGQLPMETRKVLVQLLSGPALEARRHEPLWPILLRDEALVRSRLAELFLELVVDPDMQVAFTRQADVGELEVPVLLRRAPLSFIDSVLLLFLRERLTQAEARAERAVISTEEIIEHLGAYERAANTDRAGFLKRASASIDKIRKHSLLQKIRGTDDRYEISRTLKLLFSVEEIQSLTRLYQQLASGAIAQASAGAADDEEDETASR